MGNSYTRQSAASIVNGNIVDAGPVNAEFNALQSAFDGSAGHSHSGSVGEGQKISLISSITGILPVVNGGYGGIHNITAITNPGVTDDSTKFYAVGSIWVNTATKAYYVCTDNTAGAAVWSSFQLTNSALASIAGLTTSANQTIYTTGSNTYATTALTAYGRSLIDDVDAATARGTLGLGSISTQASSAVSITGGTITGTPISGSTVAGTTGTFSAGVSGTTGTFSGAVSGTTGTFSGTITTGGNAVWHAGNLTPANYAPLAGATFTGGISGTTLNLSGTLTGVTGTFSGAVSGTTGTFSGGISGTTGTFSSTLSATGISGTTGTFSGTITTGGNAVWHAGNLTPANYAPLASPALTGVPTAPTAAALTNTTQIATTAFVTSAVAASGAPNVIIEHQTSSGINAGSAAAATWNVRTLNTKVRDPDSLMTLASNQFTPSVNMWCEFSAPATAVDGHQTRIFNVTDSVVVGYGTTGYSNNVNAGIDTSRSFGGVALVAGKTYRLDHYTQTAYANGLGYASNSGATQSYARLLFWRT